MASPLLIRFTYTVNVMTYVNGARHTLARLMPYIILYVVNFIYRNECIGYPLNNHKLRGRWNLNCKCNLRCLSCSIFSGDLFLLLIRFIYNRKFTEQFNSFFVVGNSRFYFCVKSSKVHPFY